MAMYHRLPTHRARYRLSEVVRRGLRQREWPRKEDTVFAWSNEAGSWVANFAWPQVNRNEGKSGSC